MYIRVYQYKLFVNVGWEQDDERERQRIRDKHRSKRLGGKLPLPETAPQGVVLLGSGHIYYSSIGKLQSIAVLLQSKYWDLEF